MKKSFLLMVFVALCMQAQAFDFRFLNLVNTTKVGKTYFTKEDEAFFLSWVKGNGFTSNVRFSSFTNIGFRYNYNITKNTAVFSGLGIKNVGMADRVNGKVMRARNYYIGAPLGLRIGNLKNKTELAFGGGLDVTLHHKEKSWTEGSKGTTIQKFKCVWFDDTYSPLLNPYVFTSIKVMGVGLKYQYYTNSFFKGGATNLQYLSVILDLYATFQLGRSISYNIKK